MALIFHFLLFFLFLCCWWWCTGQGGVLKVCHSAQCLIMYICSLLDFSGWTQTHTISFNMVSLHGWSHFLYRLGCFNISFKVLLAKSKSYEWYQALSPPSSHPSSTHHYIHVTPPENRRKTSSCLKTAHIYSHPSKNPLTPLHSGHNGWPKKSAERRPHRPVQWTWYWRWKWWQIQNQGKI